MTLEERVIELEAKYEILRELFTETNKDLEQAEENIVALDQNRLTDAMSSHFFFGYILRSMLQKHTEEDKQSFKLNFVDGFNKYMEGYLQEITKSIEFGNPDTKRDFEEGFRESVIGFVQRVFDMI